MFHGALQGVATVFCKGYPQANGLALQGVANGRFGSNPLWVRVAG